MTERLTDRVPPQDLEAEQSTLGSMLIDQGAADRALLILKPEDFYRDAHKLLFAAARAVKLREEPVDLTTVAAELRGHGQLESMGGPEYLTALIDEVPTAAHVVRYAQIVRECAARREMIVQAHEFMGRLFDRADGEASSLAAEFSGTLIETEQGHRAARHISESLNAHDGLWTRLAEGRLEEQNARTIRTGMPTLDAAMGGMKAGTFVVATADAGAGKSSLLTQIACNVIMAHPDKAVLYFSLEVPTYDVSSKAVAYMAPVSHWKLQWENVSDRDQEAAVEGALRLANLPLWVCDEDSLTVFDLCHIARACRLRTDISLVIVDHLQELDSHFPSGTPAHEMYSDMAQRLKHLGRELDCAVLAASQITQTEFGVYTKGGRGPVEKAHQVLGWVKTDGPGDNGERRPKKNPMGKFASFNWMKNRFGRGGVVRCVGTDAPAHFRVDIDHSQFVDPLLEGCAPGPYRLVRTETGFAPESAKRPRSVTPD